MEHTIVNLELIYEGLMRAGINAELVPAERMPGLRELRFCLGNNEGAGEERLLYACIKGRCGRLPERGGLLLLGAWTAEELAGRTGYVLCTEADALELVNAVEGVFARYTALQNRLYAAAGAERSLEAICQLAAEEFGCLASVHDEYFCFLAASFSPDEMGELFSYNEQLGCYVQDERTLRSFRTSPAYQSSLSTEGGQLWVSDFDDVRCLYVNLKVDNSFRGRLLLQSEEGSPGRLRVLSFFGDALAQALSRTYMHNAAMTQPVMRMIFNAIDGIATPPEQLAAQVKLMNWGARDLYICGVIALDEVEKGSYVALGLCSSLQLHIRGLHPCFKENRVYFLLNLTRSGISAGELRMRMAYIIRESLLHIGVSNVFEQLSDFPVYLRQAELTLDYAQQQQLTSWYNEFSAAALPYWLRRGAESLTAKGIVAGALETLKKYDQENDAELYETLKVYLTNERNGTLTGQLLRVHRSTLPHRLERIRVLTALDLDVASTRLYLLMSFALEELEEG